MMMNNSCKRRTYTDELSGAFLELRNKNKAYYKVQDDTFFFMSAQTIFQ